MTTQQDHSFESVCREYEDEREAFEAWYVADAIRQGITSMTTEEVKNLREDDHYGGHRTMLNGKWEGWQARAAAAQQSAPILDGDRTDQIAAFTHGIAPQAEAPKGAIPTEDGIRWQAGNTWPNERKAVTVDGHAWYRHDHPSVLAAPTGAQVEPVCETCHGEGTYDERIGGEFFSNPKAKCPDCDGTGAQAEPERSARLRGIEEGYDVGRRGGIGAPQLHPATSDLVTRFSDALREKLSAAEKKYGYSDGWRSGDWMDECREKLLEHVAKGDPRDVAAYCAFLWHHGESTAATQPPALSQGVTDEQIFKIAETLGKHEPGVSNYDSWGPLGYRLDEKGKYTIPVLPRNVLPFARALLSLSQGVAGAEGVMDEQRDTAYEAAMDAWEKAVPRYLRGFSEWCDRFDAARKAYDAVLAHPGAGHKEEGK